jgi:hypothetical protein
MIAFRAKAFSWLMGYRARDPMAQTSRGYTKPRRVRPGDRVGELTAIRDVGRHRYGRLWSCACECGGFAIRLASVLNAALRDRVSLCCARCLDELRRGRRDAFREVRKAYFLEMWTELGTLYLSGDDDRLARETLDDLVLAFGPLPDDDEIPHVDPTWKETPCAGQGYRARPSTVAAEREERFRRIAQGRGWLRDLDEDETL